MTALGTREDLARLMGKLRLPPGAEVEFVRVEAQRRTAGWADGAPDVQGMAHSSACAVRVISGGGQGLVKETEITASNAESLIERALLIAQNTPKDPDRFLGKPISVSGAPPENDPDIFSTPLSAVLEELKTLENAALKTSPKLKKMVRILQEEERENTTVVNSHGVHLQSQSTSTSLVVEALAEDAGQTEVAWDAQARRFGRDINRRDILLETAENAVKSLGGKALPSGPYTVLLHPRVGAQLLSLLAQAFSAEAVQTGRSFLKDRLKTAVASTEITVTDDPSLPRGLGSAVCDDEAVPSAALTMIEKGVLKNYFYDLRTAHRAKAVSNGRGFRSALAAAPAPRATNLFVAPGRYSREELLCAEKKIFLVHDIMGLHMAEPVTGEFSLGAAGFWYENGRFAHAVRGMTMAGTVTDVLMNAAAVGKEIHWMSLLGAPYLLVRGLTLSGN